MSSAASEAERRVIAAIRRVVASGHTNLRDRMTVAHICRDNGDETASDWIFDNPRLYAGLIARIDATDAGGAT